MGLHILLSFLFYNAILILIYSHYKRGHHYIKKRDLVLYTVLLIAFGTYGGGEGDYWKYKEVVESIHSLFAVTESTGMEIQYNYLAFLLNGNYNLWRLVVFSIQFIGMSWFLYKAKLNTYPVMLCFVSLCLVTSVYARSFWGAIYFFLGTYLLIEKKNPFFLLAVALCYVSHTQYIVLLALLPMAFFDLKKWHLLLLLVLFGTIVAFLKDSFTSLLETGGIEGADYVNDRMNTYSKSELGNFGNSFGELLQFILRWVPLSILFLKWIVVFFGKRRKYLSIYKPYRRVLNLTIGVVVSSIVVLVAALGGGSFFYRILGMSLFPFSILLPYMESAKTVKKKIVKTSTVKKKVAGKRALKMKAFNLYILIFAIAAEFGYLKDIYYAIANGNF